MIISNPIIIRARPSLALLTPLASLAPLTAPLPRSAAGLTCDPFFILLARHDLAPPLLAPFILLMTATLCRSSRKLCLKPPDLLFGILTLPPQSSLPANITLPPLLLQLVQLRLQLIYIVLVRVLGCLHLFNQSLCLQFLILQLTMKVLKCLRLDPFELGLPDGVIGHRKWLLVLLRLRFQVQEGLLDQEAGLFPELVEVVLSLIALDLQGLLSLRVQGRDHKLLQDVTFVVKGLQEGLQGSQRESLLLGMEVSSYQVNKVVKHRFNL